MRILPTMLALSLLVALSATLSPAQQAISAKAGMVNYFDGEVLLDGTKLEAGQAKFVQIPQGGILEATDEGRAEVLLSPGVLLWLGEGSKIELVSDDLADARVRLLAGNAILSSTEFPKDIAVTILVNEDEVRIRDTGIYRLETAPAALFVHEGEADVLRAEAETRVKKGRTLALSQPNAELAKFDREVVDELMAWAQSRDNYIQVANLSAARQVQMAGGFNNLPISMLSPAYRGFGGWVFNPYFGMYTFVPFGQGFASPWGSYFWNPGNINRAYSGFIMNGGGGLALNRGARTSATRSGFGSNGMGDNGFGGFTRGASSWGGGAQYGGSRAMSGGPGSYSRGSSSMSGGGMSGGGGAVSAPSSSSGASMSRGGASAGRGGGGGRN